MDENQYRQWLDVSDSKVTEEELEENEKSVYDDAGLYIRFSK